MIRRVNEELKFLRKGSEANAEEIWKLLQGANSEQNIEIYCAQLYELLATPEKNMSAYENEQKILATLLCVEFFKNKRRKSAQMKERLRKLLNSRKNKIYCHGVFVIYAFLQNASEIDFISGLIARMTFSPQKINWDIEPCKQIEDKIDEAYIYTRQLDAYRPEKFYSCLKKFSFPERETVQSRILSFAYVCLNDFIRTHNLQIKTTLYEYMLDILKLHMHALRHSSRSSVYLKCLIFLIQKFVVYYGCNDQEIIKEMIIWFHTSRNVPGAIGEMAEQTFHILHWELKSPGTAFRKQLRYDFPSLDIKDAKNLNKEFFLVTKKDDLFSTSGHCSLTNLRKLIIHNAVRSCGISKDYLKIIMSLNQEMTFSTYFKILKILQITCHLEVYNKIRSLEKQAIEQLFNSLEKELNEKEIKVSEEEKMRFEDLVIMQNKLGVFDYPDFEIMHIPIETFLDSKSDRGFLSLVRRNRKQKLNFYRDRLPILFYGDDTDLSKVIKILGEYMQSTDIEEAKFIKFYYVPVPDYSSSIAKYLACKDVWYNRFLYEPFKQKMIYPFLEPEAKGEGLFPTFLYRKLIHSYIREAKRTLPVRIYKCLIKYREGFQSDLRETVMFCSYLAIGSSATAEIIKAEKEREKEKFKKYLNKDYIEILIEKIKKVQTLSLALKITEVDETTDMTREIVEKNMKIDDLMVCNVPRDYFMGKQPNPSDGCLQLSILTDISGKIFRREVMNKENFKLHDEQEEKQTIQAFKDLFINMSIQDLVVQTVNPHDSFKVVIDGISYTKVESVKVQPVVNVNDLPVALPLQCFLPT